MIRYAITSDDVTAPELLRLAENADFVQLRTPGWDAGQVVALARSLPTELAAAKLLVHSRVDAALACGAAGVHLSSRPGELTPPQVRKLMPQAMVSVSCHTVEEVERAKEDGADFILFAPVFEKRAHEEVVVPGIGLETLRTACAAAGGSKVLALGGVTWENAGLCLAAGASGVAGIRLFRR